MADVEVSPDGRSSTYHYFSPSNPTLDKYVDDAIGRMADQPEPLTAAANLLLRWAESDPVKALLPDLIREYLEGRVAARAESSTIPDSKE